MFEKKYTQFYRATDTSSGAAGRDLALDRSLIPQLRGGLKGRLITPDDAEYDDARTIFYGGFDRHPAVIVRPANTGDVVYTVLMAREMGVELAVRGGGHSTAGHSVSEGGIVLDLKDM